MLHHHIGRTLATGGVQSDGLVRVELHWNGVAVLQSASNASLSLTCKPSAGNAKWAKVLTNNNPLQSLLLLLQSKHYHHCSYKSYCY